MITQKIVRELFNYNDGKLFWKILISRKIKIDKRAGYLQQDGYRRIVIYGKKYMGHRLVWLYFNEDLPNRIDHVNGIKDDNEIKNLREITVSQNAMNQKKQENCSSQYKGVTWNKKQEKWQVSICKNQKAKYLGLFNTEKEAALIYNKNAKEIFGEYAKLNDVIS